MADAPQQKTKAAGGEESETGQTGANSSSSRAASQAEVQQEARSPAQRKAQSEASGGEATDAIAMLKADHRAVEQLFAQYEKGKNRAARSRILEDVCNALKIHAELEETIFYPAVREAADDDSKLDEAQVEHDSAKILIAELESGNPADEFHDAKVKVLSEYVKHHVEEEEGSGGVLEQARKARLDTKALGQEMSLRKQELQADPSRLRARSISFGQTGQNQAKEKSAMARGNGNDNGMRGGQGRDEQGRFTDRGYDDDRSYSSRGSGRRDDYDDDRGRSSRGSRDDDDGRGRGGWFGDSQGHSEAARKGWDDRERSGSRGYDDRGRSMSSRGGRDDDDRGRSSRGRDDDDGRGRGGWFGDPEGHSEAARKGWDNRDDDDRGRSSRGGRHDDDRSRSSRSRDDDDDRGRSGWFGDPRGHSEAARRGWEDRR